MATKQKAKKSTKKKATKQAKSNLAAELDGLAPVTHTNCFTDPDIGQRWKSRLNDTTPDGAFTIGDGASFSGHHSVRGNVDGQCLGNGMSITVRDGSRTYQGTYVAGTSQKKIHGTSRSITLLASLATGAPLPAPDVWDADKET